MAIDTAGYRIVDRDGRLAERPVKTAKMAADAVQRGDIVGVMKPQQVVDRLGYPIAAVMTDNDLVFTMRYAYYSRRRTRFQQACRSLGIRHQLVRPHSPESNGKVERFIKTVDDECFAIRRPRSSRRRIRVLEAFMQYYNHDRPHLSLAGLTPIQRRDAYFAQLRLMS